MITYFSHISFVIAQFMCLQICGVHHIRVCDLFAVRHAFMGALGQGIRIFHGHLKMFQGIKMSISIRIGRAQWGLLHSMR